MTRLSRRGFLQVGLAGGVTAIGRAAASPDPTTTMPVAEATYIEKHARMRALTFQRFADRFAASDTAVEQQFAKSIPFTSDDGEVDITLKVVLRHLLDLSVGGRLGDVASVKWYGETVELSQYNRVFDRGIMEDRTSMEGAGQAGGRAQTANEELSTLAADVADAAETYRSEETESAAVNLRDRLDAERAALADPPSILSDWTEIDPGAYSPVDETAKTVREIARRNVDAAEQFHEAVTAQRSALDEAGIQFDVAQFADATADGSADSMPGPLADTLANVYLMEEVGETNPADSTAAIALRTDDNGTVDTYRLVPVDDADLHVFTTRAVLTSIAERDRPGQAVAAAVDDERIVLDGQGFLNDLKFEVGPDVAEAIGGLL